jgi:Right handed beta helix region
VTLSARFPWLLCLTLACPTLADAETIEVTDDQGLAALAQRGLQPGDVVRLGPGDYERSLRLADVRGTRRAPIVIEGADPERPPVLVAGSTALQLAGCEHVVLRNLIVRGQAQNGVNLDDGGERERPSRWITVEGLTVEGIGPRGNHDGLKLSGLEDFTVRRCVFRGWGGSAIDMVGCHRGTIEDCTFEGRRDEGFSANSGIQCKGGTAEIRIRGCRFQDAGARAINLGGSTGLDYFRPPDADHEARDLLVEGCLFEGSDAPLAFVGVTGAVVQRNTFRHPQVWVLRILQERREERFVRCGDNVFRDNVIVFRRDQLRRAVNVGPDTRPETFQLSGNWWYAEDDVPGSRPDLPVQEADGVYGVDPELDADGVARHRRARGVGRPGR